MRRGGGASCGRPGGGSGVAGVVGMCGRPVSWSTGPSWRVPHSAATDTTCGGGGSSMPSPSTASCSPTDSVVGASGTKFSAGVHAPGCLMESSCEEEGVTDGANSDASTPTLPREVSPSSDKSSISSNNGSGTFTNRLRAKSSLDETKLRTNINNNNIRVETKLFDNETFMRSDTVMRTPCGTAVGGGGGGGGAGVGTVRGVGVGSVRGAGVKTALARSSSYQALHSALARLYRLDDFTTERLGQGFFSEVFKVRHRITGDIMVLKMNKLVSNRHNMLREVELMNRLHHNNILTYYGVCINEGQVHALSEVSAGTGKAAEIELTCYHRLKIDNAVIEQGTKEIVAGRHSYQKFEFFINGGSLDVILQDRAVEVSWWERVSLAADTARGMAYLHSMGVFHRDLTSKNVLIKEMGVGSRRRREAVVADFGLAAPIPKDKSVRMRQVGSPYWMAPEVIRGEWYDHRADVFSFGIILCEMIARCEADPDVLPRTNNFGVHYLAFSRMCQNDCPPYFLQMAFQCCQIDPDMRPSFEVLTKNFESLLNRLVGHRAASAHRKPKVCHRRSLSDDCLMLGRGSSSDDSSGGSGGGGSIQGAATTGGLGSCAANNSITPVAAEVGRTPQEVVERMGAADPYFTPSTATVNPFTRVKLPAPSRLTVQDGARFCHSLPEPLPPHRHYNNGRGAGPVRPQQQLPQHGSHTSLVAPDPTSSGAGRGGGPQQARPDGGGGSGGGVVPHGPLAGAVKRRGSGESGFFSVGDMDRTGTPDMWHSFSELSCTSLAWEDEERSWVTDSSEELCVGGQEEPDAHDTDIKAIVEFFERGYGSMKSGPLLVPRSSRLSPRSPASPPHGHVWGSNAPRTKAGLRPMHNPRRDINTFRVKDRPKLYITEGTVRARRDIFEAK